MRRAGGDVTNGGRVGWLGFEDGEETIGGEVAGDELGDMIVVILGNVGLPRESVSVDVRVKLRHCTENKPGLREAKLPVSVPVPGYASDLTNLTSKPFGTRARRRVFGERPVRGNKRRRRDS